MNDAVGVRVCVASPTEEIDGDEEAVFFRVVLLITLSSADRGFLIDSISFSSLHTHTHTLLSYLHPHTHTDTHTDTPSNCCTVTTHTHTHTYTHTPTHTHTRHKKRETAHLATR